MDKSWMRSYRDRLAAVASLRESVGLTLAESLGLLVAAWVLGAGVLALAWLAVGFATFAGVLAFAAVLPAPSRWTGSGRAWRWKGTLFLAVVAALAYFTFDASVLAFLAGVGPALVLFTRVAVRSSRAG